MVTFWELVLSVLAGAQGAWDWLRNPDAAARRTARIYLRYLTLGAGVAILLPFALILVGALGGWSTTHLRGGISRHVGAHLPLRLGGAASCCADPLARSGPEGGSGSPRQVPARNSIHASWPGF